jgi:hypothetical protein
MKKLVGTECCVFIDDVIFSITEKNMLWEMKQISNCTPGNVYLSNLGAVLRVCGIRRNFDLPEKLNIQSQKASKTLDHSLA